MQILYVVHMGYLWVSDLFPPPKNHLGQQISYTRLLPAVNEFVHLALR